MPAPAILFAMINAVLFDFAGTLFMPRPAIDQVLEAASALGLELSAAERQRLASECEAAGIPGGPYPATVPDDLQELYERRDLSPKAHRAAYVGLLSSLDHPDPELPVTIYEQILRPEGWIPYPDAQPVIAELERREIRVGLISNVGFDIRPILRAHGFPQLADRCTLSYELGVIKPAPRIFAAALSTLGGDAAQTLMVGDHATVDRGAEALGIRTVILPMTAPGTEHGLERVLEMLA